MKEVYLSFMHKANAKEITPDASMSEYFVGRVGVRRVVDDRASKEVELFLVEFHNGARTKLHYHEVDQILMAAKGKGVVAIHSSTELFDPKTAKVAFEDVQEMNEGDAVLIPAFKWHWHGAAPGKDFAHYQMKKVGKTVWLEK